MGRKPPSTEPPKRRPRSQHGVCDLCDQMAECIEWAEDVMLCPSCYSDVMTPPNLNPADALMVQM